MNDLSQSNNAISSTYINTSVQYIYNFSMYWYLTYVNRYEIYNAFEKVNIELVFGQKH